MRGMFGVSLASTLWPPASPTLGRFFCFPPAWSHVCCGIRSVKEFAFEWELEMACIVGFNQQL